MTAWLFCCLTIHLKHHKMYWFIHIHIFHTLFFIYSWSTFSNTYSQWNNWINVTSLCVYYRNVLRIYNIADYSIKMNRDKMWKWNKRFFITKGQKNIVLMADKIYNNSNKCSVLVLTKMKKWGASILSFQKKQLVNKTST